MAADEKNLVQLKVDSIAATYDPVTRQLKIHVELPMRLLSRSSFFVEREHSQLDTQFIVMGHKDSQTGFPTPYLAEHHFNDVEIERNYPSYFVTVASQSKIRNALVVTSVPIQWLDVVKYRDTDAHKHFAVDPQQGHVKIRDNVDTECSRQGETRYATSGNVQRLSDWLSSKSKWGSTSVTASPQLGWIAGTATLNLPKRECYGSILIETDAGEGLQCTNYAVHVMSTGARADVPETEDPSPVVTPVRDHVLALTGRVVQQYPGALLNNIILAPPVKPSVTHELSECTDLRCYYSCWSIVNGESRPVPCTVKTYSSLCNNDEKIALIAGSVQAKHAIGVANVDQYLATALNRLQGAKQEQRRCSRVTVAHLTNNSGITVMFDNPYSRVTIDTEQYKFHVKDKEVPMRGPHGP